MNFNKQNSQAISEVLVTDMQKRLFQQYNDYKADGNTILTDDDYDTALSLMISKILNCNSLGDVNELILEYSDIFTTFDDYGILATTQGTLNYIISLLINTDPK